MSAGNAVIAVVEKNQTRAITISNDGDKCMPILIKNYGSQKLAKKLVGFGNLHALAEMLNKKQNVSKPIEDARVACGKNRDQIGAEAKIFPSSENFFERAGECYPRCSFIYIFEGGKWFSFGADYDEEQMS